jgi:hypothetical protein
MNGPLRQQQIEQFSDEGFLVCPEFLEPAQVDELRGWVEEIALWPTTLDRWEHRLERTAGGPVLARTENFLPYHAAIAAFLGEGRISAALSQLFGEPAVVFKEKINYKHPGGGGFAPHQDAAAYKFGAAHLTTLVAVDENSEENGCLWFAPGQHRRGLLAVDDKGCLPQTVADALDWTAAPVPPGGVVFFSSYAPHKSGPNASARSRRGLYVTYNRAAEGDLRSVYYEDRRRAIDEFSRSHDAGGPPRISTIGHFQGRSVE